MPHHHGRSGTSAGVAQGSTKSTSSGGGKDRHPPITTYKTTSTTAKQPKKNIVTKIKEGVSASIKARRKTAYNFANFIPGMEEGLKRNRLDYKSYLSDRGVKTDFLEVDDKTLTSFDTYEELIAYKPTQAKPRTPVLNYADYLASKGNYNLQRSGNVGGITNRDGNELSNNVVKKVVGGQTLLAQGPTDAEVSQSDATNAAETKLTKRRVKARGRKMNIYTQAKDKLTLGKKSLLGYV